MTDSPDTDAIRTEAIDWVVRINDPAFDGWEAFEQWLSASPAHADAYHAAAFAEAQMVAVVAATPTAAPVAYQNECWRRRWPAWAGAAVAASLIAVVGYRAHLPVPPPRIIETAAGVQRTVALEGSTIVLNGGTRILVDAGNARALTLERGEALFTVRHDAARPFSVIVGTARVVDVGTRFNMVREGAAVRVAVSEGIVDWQRNGDAVRVTSGNELRATETSADVALSPIAPDDVGGWSTGQLVYDGIPLGAVADDLSRSLGVAIIVSPALRTRAVRGVIRLEGGPDDVMPRVALLLDVHASKKGDVWRLLPSH